MAYKLNPFTGNFDLVEPAPLTTKGDILSYSTALARLGVGADTTVLTADSTQATGLKWSTVAGGGDVTKVGTPVDNQVGVWTGDGTIEGTTGFTYDGSVMSITGNINIDGTYKISGTDLAYTDITNSIGSTAVITDNTILRGDGGARLIQESSPTINDTGEIDMTSQKITSVLDPTSAQDAATKNYVDMSVSFISSYFLNNTASDIGGIYYKMLEAATGEVQSSFTTAGLTAGNDQALTNWATDPNIPGVNTLKAGVYSAHIHAEKTVGTRSVNLYFEIYTRTSGGVETLRVTSAISSAITSNVHIELHASIASAITIGTTDRIIVKWLANIGGSGSDATVVLYTEGDTDARTDIPTTVEVLDSVFVRQDGTKELTANWDVGAFTITGTQFISDIAIGTAPFVVTSTTEVANLKSATVGTITGLAPDTQNTYARTQFLIPYADTTTSFGEIAIGTVNQVLTSNGAGLAPTFQDASGGGANVTLSNLTAGSVAINTTLASDTDNTDDLGTAPISWANLWLGNTSVITWSTAPSTADITLTHSANLLTFAGGTIALGTATATGGLTGDLTGNADTVTAFTPASGSLTLSGADALTLTTTAATNVTLPTTGTLMANLVEDTTPQLGGELDCQANSIGYTVQTATGDGATTIDWGNGNVFTFTFGAFNETFTFTAPTNPGLFTLKLIQDGTGSRTATWPATVKWPQNIAPTLTTAASSVDIVTFFYDGTNYNGLFAPNFS